MSSGMKYEITLEYATENRVRDAIVNLVVAFNNSKAGLCNGQPLFVVLRDQEGHVCGGLSGSEAVH
jgi:hypothetical protein